MRYSLKLLLLISLLFLQNTALAVDKTPDLLPDSNFKQLSAELDKAQALLNIPDLQSEEAETAITTSTTIEQQANQCIQSGTEQQAKLQQTLNSLGEARDDEEKSLKATRKKLGKQLSELENTLTQCRLLGVRTKTLRSEAQLLKQGLVKQHLFSRTPTLFTHAQTLLRQPNALSQQSHVILDELRTLPIDQKNTLMAIGFGFTSFLLGLIWTHYKRTQYRQSAPTISQTSPTLAALWRNLLRTLPYLMLLAFTALSFQLYSPGSPIIKNLSLTLLMFATSYAILQALLRPAMHIEGFQPLAATASTPLKSWAKVLLVTLLIGALFYTPLFDKPLFSTEKPSSLLSLIRGILGTITGIALVRLIWILQSSITLLRTTKLHLIVTLLSSIAVGALWLGYYNLSTFLFSAIFSTLFVLLFGWLAIRIPNEIFDGLDDGTAPWQKRLRAQLRLQKKQIIPGLFWVRLAHILAVCGLVIILLLRIWGTSDQTLKLTLMKLSGGFEIAGFLIDPLRILSGLLLIAILISLTQVFKRYLSETWLRRTNLSRSAREATITVSGYVGVLIAILLGLSIAGIQFSNLAIIAGALSVGIGFGLQNIVNNFVSGLILLFERPIRRGDWVKIGEAEGIVKDISIRSTLIQTFDRSEIVVPNSELISGQVTNMFLQDTYGRIIIPIGVAYGSDTELVMKLLREVAEAHPKVLKDRPEMDISVYFRHFGDSSLNFELRCFIENVDSKLSVTSELNLAIDKAFRDAKIEIPFPQRTIHLEQA